MSRKFSNHKLVKIILLIILLLGPLILFFLPSDYFDQGQSVCLSVVFFDLECYGCGMTRALMHLIHFEFFEAYQYNNLVILVFPLLFLWWLKIVLSLFGKKILKWF
tara:strand:+ start:961 stop:1278 length:318 start_codon:yes stop_codon:yes gene_type:complete